jgi:S-disulfanyl-L-cysteine oxidoreductase SoxD
MLFALAACAPAPSTPTPTAGAAPTAVPPTAAAKPIVAPSPAASPAPVVSPVAKPAASPAASANANPAPSPAANPAPSPAVSPVAAASPSPRPLNTPLAAPRPAAPGIVGLGRPASSADIVAFAIPSDGRGLPPGSGTAAEGAPIYAAKCATCHGDAGQGTPNGPQLVAPVPWQVGGPITMGNFAPYAPPIMGYIWGSMPYDQPQTLSPSEAYALTAWILAQHKIIADTDRMDAQSLPQVKMPNHDAFRQGDPRPDVP